MTEFQSRYLNCISSDGFISEVFPNCATDKLDLKITIDDPNFANYYLENQGGVQISMRSKLCRAGFDFITTGNIKVEYTGKITVPGKIINLNSGPLIETNNSVAELFKVGDKIARIFSMPTDKRIDSNGILTALLQSEISLPEGFIVSEDGVISVPCANRIFTWSNGFILCRNTMEQLLNGTISRESFTNGILKPKEITKLSIPPQTLVISEISGINIGPYHGVIVRQNTMPGLDHLSAVMLDPYSGCNLNGKGISETGNPKVEIFNTSNDSIVNPRVSLCLYDLRLNSKEPNSELPSIPSEQYQTQ